MWQLEAELFPVCFKLRNVLPCGCILFIESGGRKLNENKALTSKKARLVFNPDFSFKKKKKGSFLELRPRFLTKQGNSSKLVQNTP